MGQASLEVLSPATLGSLLVATPEPLQKVSRLLFKVQFTLQIQAIASICGMVTARAAAILVQAIRPQVSLAMARRPLLVLFQTIQVELLLALIVRRLTDLPIPLVFSLLQASQNIYSKLTALPSLRAMSLQVLNLLS